MTKCYMLKRALRKLLSLLGVVIDCIIPNEVKEEIIGFKRDFLEFKYIKGY